MRNNCEANIQTKKEAKEAQEAKQKENDEQIIGQDSQKRNIEVRVGRGEEGRKGGRKTDRQR